MRERLLRLTISFLRHITEIEQPLKDQQLQVLFSKSFHAILTMRIARNYIFHRKLVGRWGVAVSCSWSIPKESPVLGKKQEKRGLRR